MIRIRDHILSMDAYHPPLAGRSAKLRMDFNENLQGPGQAVMKAAAALGPEDFSMYPDDRDASKAAADFFQVPEDSLLLTNGADEGIQCIVNLLIEKDDTVPLLEPTYAMYRIYLSIAGADLQSIYYEEDLRFPRDGLLQGLQKNPKLVFLCSPNNPTGTAIDLDWLRGAIKSHPDTMFAVDEAYADFSGSSLLSGEVLPENVLVLRTFSKSCGLAGLRVGAVIGAPSVIALLRKIRSPYSIAGLSLRFLQTALQDPSYIHKYIQQVITNRDALQGWLAEREIKVYPSTANFLLLHIGDTVDAFCKDLLDDGILVRSRDKDPLLKGCVRITIGLQEEMKRLQVALDRWYS